jgi:4-amino-4-deoxy-L-arabinose transferase-like glycosyltransferase
MTILLADPLTAVTTVCATAFSPLFLFYSFKIMPDVTMLMFMVTSFYLFLQFMKSRGLIYLCGSAICLFASGAIKPLALSLFLPMVYLYWSKWRFDLRKLLVLGGYVAIVLLSVLAWLLYARSVSRAHHSVAYYLGDNLLDFPRYLFDDLFFRKLVLQWPAELWVGYAFVPAFIWGLIAVWKTELRKLMQWWLLSVYLVFAVTAMHSSTHDYYTLVIVPLMAIVSGFGLAHLLSRNGWRRHVAVVLIALAPVTACLRIAHRFGDTTDYYQIRQSSDDQVPRESLVAVEDYTKAVRLYQMNRHGWPIQDSVTAELVLARQKLGARYLVLKRPIEQYQGLSAGISTVARFRLGPLFAYELAEKR